MQNLYAPTYTALIHSKLNLWRQHSARLSFQWVVVCQSEDTEDFLWAVANMKVFLWCWLCYFQLKEGVHHNVYVFTWQYDSFNLFLLRSRRNCLVDKQWTKSKKLTVCVLTDYLKIGCSTLLQVDLSISAVGTAYSAEPESTAQVCFETESNHFLTLSF